MKLRILTTCYNASNWIARCITSIKDQAYTDYKVYITDDLSTDNSVEVAKGVIGNDTRFEIIENVTKMYQPGNYWQVLQRDEIDDEDIVITLDGDDWFANADSIDTIVNVYKNSDTLVTCGQFVEYHGNGEYRDGFVKAPEVFENLRSEAWTSSHLRTFKAHMFRRIKKEDLICPETNRFWDMTGDLAFMMPILEMAGKTRAKYLEREITMVYNMANPLNDYKQDLDKQHRYASLIRNKSEYKPI